MKKQWKYLDVIVEICIIANDYEKSRNEKSRNMKNPFKFGTIVEEEYFTDRVEEVAYISRFVDSAKCHLYKSLRVGRSFFQRVDY